MEKQQGFTVELSSRCKEWWCYNVDLVCGCFDERGERVDFRSVASEVAPAGSNLETRPDGVEPYRRVKLSAPDCHHLMLYIYIIPHTLPRCTLIEDAEPFNISLKITRNGKVVHDQRHAINRWSGASVELKVE